VRLAVYVLAAVLVLLATTIAFDILTSGQSQLIPTKDPVATPNLIGTPVPVAHRELHQLNLRAQDDRGWKLPGPSRVIEQWPPPGTRIPPNSFVRLVISIRLESESHLRANQRVGELRLRT
jgi:beta-lactam-binding protein with PASTA domain